MFLNKRGQTGGGDEVPPASITGILTVVILFFITGSLFVVFFEVNKIDNTSLNGFNMVAQGVSSVYKTQGQPIKEPVQIGTDYILVGFGKDENVKEKPCMSTKIVKPEIRECAGVACLCICENTGTEEMCTLEKTECVPFNDINFVFADVCNVVFGKGEPQMVKIEMGSKGMILS